MEKYSVILPWNQKTIGYNLKIKDFLNPQHEDLLFKVIKRE